MNNCEYCVLVSGGAGFVGSWTVEKLVDKYSCVVVLDNLYSGGFGNLRGCLDHIVFVKGDVRDRELVLDVMKRYSVKAVVHLAAIVSVDEVYRDPILGYEVNVGGTFNVLEASRILDADIFVYASSAAVYGDPMELPIREDHRTRPKSVYGATKLGGEVLVRGYAENYGLTTVILRYFNVYGPRMRPGPYAGVIYKFIRRALRNEPLIIYGDGEQTRDFVYVEDVAEANLKALLANRSGVYNVGTGKPITIRKLADKIIEMTGSTSRIVYDKPRPGDIKHSYADITKTIDELGWKPKTSLDQGLIKTIEYLKKHSL